MRWSLPSFVLFALIALAPSAHAQMSESEKKSAARAAYTEGVQLQDAGKPAEALARFEAAQKLYDAPTHQLHIAECQALTGKLLESQETYEALVHRNLGANPAEAFQQAQEQAKAELVAVRARIPNLRLTVRPDASQLQNLQVTMNGVVVPNDLLGIARPVNPGTYKVNAAANGYKLATPIDLPIGERDAKNDPKNLELVLQPASGQPTLVVVPPPVPPPYTGTGANPPPPTSDPPKDKEQPKKEPPPGSSATGLLVGGRLGVLIPGGGIVKNATNTSQDVSFDNVATTGGSFGVDLMARFARLLIVGGTLEFGGLGGPSNLGSQLASGVKADTTQRTTYFGVNLGIVPNIDKVSFFGELGLGLRTLSRTVTIANVDTKESLSGAEFELGAGLMIPAGPVRILPKAALSIGAFGSGDSDCATRAGAAGFRNCLPSGSIDNTSTHTFFWVGLGGYYHADLGKKAQ